MNKTDHTRIGKNAMLLLLLDREEEEWNRHFNELNWSYCTGKIGSMDSQKIVAAIETAAKRSDLVREDLYREMHALYHAIMEALTGVTRGQTQLGEILRTVGLRFSVVRGTPYESEEEGEWIAVALYGTIGAPIKGLEHETIGLGINHI
ncbi:MULTISPECIES: hut operon transcriptional regulator HutP [Bacillaceae]|uniref:Hut operon positive regulatory protein n=2 Tax=Rossellomorea vietnamensis TaxID=218284 RepID=A0A6I6UPQ8_9BACI|nr:MULTISPECIES: hut operon transcriptional regulator HutP [Bacillaceae]OXS55469.1 transcriptional regulator [Bacillus sp. DSM 27956]PRX70900.1 hut operon positive regulator [Bacillus sp. V-88]PFG04389.1 hut operon positive regulator [Bacillus sp. es.034]QHE63387.1 hut operon transcriptional regulator HutP [Rossellomorea vietnamensis]WGG45469.1 hut operon transcriptional regulator HutP [Rossellomorea sp. DA94]